MSEFKKLIDTLASKRFPKATFKYEVEEPLDDGFYDITSVEHNYLFGRRTSKKVYRKVVLQDQDAEDERTNIIGFQGGKIRHNK